MDALALDNKLNINLNDSLGVGLLNNSKDPRDKAINYSFLSGSDNLNNNSENNILLIENNFDDSPPDIMLENSIFFISIKL